MKYFKNKKIAIIGAGMIGKPLINLLKEDGADLVIFTNSVEEYRYLTENDLQKNAFVCDLIKNPLYFKEYGGYDYVFNLGGKKGSVSAANKNPVDFLYINTMLGMNLTQSSFEMKVKGYLYTSSLAVYDFSTKNILSDKENIWNTSPSPYDLYGGYGKRMGELSVEAFRKQYKWKDAYIVRPSNIYGPYDNFGEGSMIIPSLIKRAYETVKKEKTELEIYGTGDEVRTFTYSEDCARAMMFTMENKVPVVNIAGPAFTIRNIADIICNAFNLNPVYLGSPHGDQSKMIDNITLHNLSFKYKTDIKKGIENTIDWYDMNL